MYFVAVITVLTCHAISLTLTVHAVKRHGTSVESHRLPRWFFERNIEIVYFIITSLFFILYFTAIELIVKFPIAPIGMVIVIAVLMENAGWDWLCEMMGSAIEPISIRII